MTTQNDLPEKKKSPSRLKQWVLGLAVVCLLVFVVGGVVGVVRGYSVQSWVPVWICLVGVVLLIPFQRRHSWASFLSSACLIVFALVGIGQGDHQRQGEVLYEEGKYEEAITEFRREIETWYLRLQFNSHEAPSLFQIAQSQSQLGRFEEARETYREVEEKFRGFYKDRAQIAGATVENKLAEIDELNKKLAEASDGSGQAQVHFDLALAYRELTCDQKAIEHYEAIQKLDAPERFKESAKKFADKLR